MAISSGPSKHNAELNIIPFIDILSTCICFLLMTTVWLQVGAFNMAQATGAPTEESTQQKPLLHLRIDRNQDLSLVFKEFPEGKRPSNFSIQARGGEANLEMLKQRAGAVQDQFAPVETVLIEPQSGVSYEQIVKVISVLRELNMKSVGLMPLSNEIPKSAQAKKASRRAGGGQ